MRLITEQLLGAMRTQDDKRCTSDRSGQSSSDERGTSRRGGLEFGKSGASDDSHSRSVWREESELAEERTRRIVGYSANKHKTFLDGAAELENPPLRAPRNGRAYHIYCSPLVEGGLALTEELRNFYGSGMVHELRVTEHFSELALCDYMLVYLTRETWQHPAESAAFAEEVAFALRSGVQLLLAHEMPGLDQPELRAVEFSHFFEPDQTPKQLIRAGIYSQVAVSGPCAFTPAHVTL